MLELVDLHKRFGDVVALDGCDFTARPGRLTGFLGPNGAGKTTAMRCVFGLVTPESGEVRWNGRPVTQADLRRFGYMPEERGLYPRMRVVEQLRYFGRLAGMAPPAAHRAADRWLVRLGLADRAEDRVETLSHGNQQRVQLAVALLHDPELVVLDEPFAGLDPLAIDALGAQLAELSQTGVTILFSSHQLDLVEHLCEDVVIVDHGRVVLAGMVDELRMSSPKRLIDMVVRDPATSWTPDLRGIEVLSRDDGHVRLRIDRDVDLEQVLASLRESGEQLSRITYEPPALSDLFKGAVS